MKQTVSILAAVLILTPMQMGGCVDPATTAISVNPITKTIHVKSTKDETVTLNRLAASGSSATEPWKLEVNGLALNSNASAVNPGLVELQDARTRLMAQHGANIIGGIDAVGRIVTTLAPTLTAYVEGNTSVGLAKQQTEQMKAEAISLIAGGFLNPSQAQSLLDRVPPAVRTGVMDDPVVKAALAKMQAEIESLTKPIAPPPTEPPHERDVGFIPPTTPRMHTCLAYGPMSLRS